MDIFTSLNFYQFFTPLMSVLMIAILISRKMRRQVSNLGFLFGLIIWLGVALISLFPDAFINIFTLLGIKEGVRAIIFFAIIILSLATYNLILHTDKLEQEITLLTRELAMRDLEEKRK